MSETTTEPTGLVARIMKFLKLDEAGKLQGFFDKQIKVLKREIETYNQAIKNSKYNSERTMDSLREKLEDATQEVEDAYADVKPESIETNAKQDEFARIYWDKVSRAEQKVESIKEQIKSASEDLDETIKGYEDQIAERQHRIDKIS